MLVDDRYWVHQGGRFFVPQVGDYADGVLGPGESADIPFTVCQPRPQKFYLLVDVFGTAGVDQ